MRIFFSTTLLLSYFLSAEIFCTTFADEVAHDNVFNQFPILSSPSLLKGQITSSPSPFLEGQIEALPEGTNVIIQLSSHLNSQLSHKGDEILGRIAVNTASGEHVLLPAGWYMHGNVTDVSGQRRLGRAGYVEVEFDKIISPDGNYELPFKATFSTHDNKLKAIAKIVTVDSGYVSYGALGGAILAVQLTGIPAAIATHGMTVAGGAAIGGTIGLVGALKRKGKIEAIFPGDTITMKVDEPITLPAFDPKMLSSAQPKHYLQSVQLHIAKIKFNKDPSGDRKARLLTVDLAINNQSSREFAWDQLVVVSDHSLTPYLPYMPMTNFSLLKQKIAPSTQKQGEITFSVDSPKYRYFLVLVDRIKGTELSRVPLN